MTDRTGLKVCIAGKNQIAVNALLYMVEAGWKDRLVVCPNRTDDGVSRWQPSLVRFAQEIGIEVVTLDTVQDIEDLIFFSLEFDRLVKPSAFKSCRLYNIHFSALPAYKGMYTSVLPILHGSSKSGVTLHVIESGIDTGPIIDQHVFPLPDIWTARDLYFAYLDQSFKLLRKNFDELVDAKPPVATPQSAKGSTYYSKSSIDYNNLSINLRDTAEGIVRQLRAFSFREYQTPVIHGLEIGSWEILPEVSLEDPGTILHQDSENVKIATIDYQLNLSRSCAWDWFALTADSRNDGNDPKLIDIRDRFGWTPLIRAAYAGDVELCRRLLEAGANPNCTNLNGTSALMYACSGKDPDGVAKILQEFGADAKHRDLFGKSLAHYHPSLTRKLSP